MFHRLMLFALAASLCACSSLERSSGSGYGQGHSGQVETYHAPDARDGENEQLATRTRLKQLENAIRTRKEMDQYSRALPYLKNEKERIEFLELSDFEARQAWMNKVGFLDRPKKVQDTMQELIEAQDIAVGMPQTLVRKAWGEPEHIEVSGNPQFRNERWRYSKYVSTPEGYKLERKLVYFEGGKVSGWEIE